MGTWTWRRAVAPAIVAGAAIALMASAPPGAVPAVAAAGAPDGAVFSAAGDIDGCHQGKDTADLVERTAGPVATIGDNAYPDGSAGDYSKCYAPSWGEFKDRTHPVPGNHDYDASQATPYYQYFGAAAGTPGSGWYSYDVGSWHLVALNSNCDNVDCGKESTWLDGDLAAHPSACVLAYWHHPRFTSGTSGGDNAVGAFWKVLYAHGATIVLNGHDHDYERFAPQNPSGRPDPKGIREFIVGTGGATLGSFAGTAPNSEVRNNNTYGVLQLTLRPGGYDWRFVPVDGDSFTDTGSGTCQGAAPPAGPAVTPPPSSAAPPATPPDESPTSPTTSAGPSADPAPQSPANTGSDGTTTPGSARPRSRPASTAPTPAPTPSRSARPSDPISGRVGPTATPSDLPAADPTAAVTAPSPIAAIPPLPAAGDPAGTPARADGGAEPSGAPVAADADADADPDTAASLALTIARLTRGAPSPHHADRHAAILLAVALMAADGAAIAALRRRARCRGPEQNGNFERIHGFVAGL